MTGVSDPPRKCSRTLPSDIAEAARARSGASGLSSYGTAAVARRLERDNLAELVATVDAETGPISEEEIQEKRDLLAQAREQQSPNRAPGPTAFSPRSPASP